MSKMSRGQRALGRIRVFLSQNCKHWKQDVGYIEEELKDYHEIKEIAKRYHFDDLARDTHMTTTDEKYLRLFNAAIPSIQENYRKAKAFDIIKTKTSLDFNLSIVRNSNSYDEYLNHFAEVIQERLRNGESVQFAATEDEFYSLKRAME